jgi:phosphoribosyl 1,2-cyclic phosphodiesterase
MTNDLTVRFLGVRGSIATPGMAAGGNTACLEVVAGDTRIILDAGTGLRTLGNERMQQGIRHSTILLSHLPGIMSRACSFLRRCTCRVIASRSRVARTA